MQTANAENKVRKSNKCKNKLNYKNTLKGKNNQTKTWKCISINIEECASKCTDHVGVVISTTDCHCPQLNSIHVPESDFRSHFGTLLENMEGSDVTFDVAGEKISGHKLVLAARSPEFGMDM